METQQDADEWGEQRRTEAKRPWVKPEMECREISQDVTGIGTVNTDNLTGS